MRTLAPLLAAIVFSFHVEAKAQEPAVFPGVLEFPVLAGSTISKTCATGSWPSACVTFPASQAKSFEAAYRSRLREDGWRERGGLFVKVIPELNCEMLLALGTGDRSSWRARDIAELGILNVGCSGIEQAQEDDR